MDMVAFQPQTFRDIAIWGATLSVDGLEGLLLRIADGDRVAFRDFYAATAPRIMAVARALMRDTAKAEEIVQETYVRLWQNAARYDPTKGHPLAWLTVMTRRLAIDDLRRRRPVLPLDEAAETVLAALEDETAEADPLGADRLRSCLGKLRSEYRHVVVLAHVHGYTYEELAQRFDRPVGTIKTWVHRGLADLRICME
jgi:RNA polymerase sigma-70 factor, ECF subfamily